MGVGSPVCGISHDPDSSALGGFHFGEEPWYLSPLSRSVVCHVLIVISPICTVMCWKLKGSSESGGFSPRMIFGCPRNPGVWDPHPEPQWSPWPGGVGCWALIWVLDRPAVELAPPPSPPQAVGSRSQGASCFSRTPGPPTFTLSWRHSTSFAWPSPLLGSQPQVLGCH